MPLKHILKNKLRLQKAFNLQEFSIDNWPYWMFEENIKLVNEIQEEDKSPGEGSSGNRQQNNQNFDTKSMMDNMRNMTKNMPKIK